MTNLFSNAKFAEEYKTTNNKRAIFLRFAENSEGQYAFFYVEDWGTVQVFVDSGKEVHGDIEHSILPFKREHPQGLDEAAEDSWVLYEYRESPKGLYSTCYVDGFKAGAKWMAGQFEEEAYEEEVQELYQDEDGVHCVVSVGVDYNPGDKVIVQIRKA